MVFESGRPPGDGLPVTKRKLDNEDADTDATLASSTENNLENKTPANSYGKVTSGGLSGTSPLQPSGQLATPASSVGSLDVDVTAKEEESGWTEQEFVYYLLIIPFYRHDHLPRYHTANFADPHFLRRLYRVWCSH